MNEEQRKHTLAMLNAFVEKVGELALKQSVESGNESALVNRPAVIKGVPASECYILDDAGFILESRSKTKNASNNIKDHILHEDLWVWCMIRQKAEVLKPLEVSMRTIEDNDTIRIMHCEITRLKPDRYLCKLLLGERCDISERLKRMP